MNIGIVMTFRLIDLLGLTAITKRLAGTSIKNRCKDGKFKQCLLSDNAIFRFGIVIFTIRTTLDYEAQKIAETAVATGGRDDGKER